MMGKNHGYCIINGKVENLSEIQKMLDSGKEINGEITIIMMDKYGLEPIDAYLFEELVLKEGIPANHDEILKQRDLEMAQRPSCMVHCKYCGSTNVQKLGYWSGGWRATYGGLQWHCNSCGSDF